MHEEALRNILNELSSQLDQTAEEPRTQIEVGHPNHVFISGNQPGLVSLAVASLSASLCPVDDGELPRPFATLPERHYQYVAQRQQKYLGWIGRQENIPESEEVLAARQRPWRFRDRVALFGCACVGFIIMLLLITGMGVWIGILLGGFQW